MKVTKKDFVEAMTGNVTIFAGIVRFFDADYLTSAVHDFIDRVNRDNLIVNKRTCEARSHDLVFSGGSHLDLRGNDFYKLDCGNCEAYVCVETWLDTFDNSKHQKSMVYVIDK